MGTLYIVATPIGNLEDVTLRALRVLREVKLIAAEDTRRTRTLLAKYDIKTPLISYHEYNKKARLPYILRFLEQGDVALVSEAGMPGLNDPGYELVVACTERGLPIVPVPGASAPITALAISGLPTDHFLYLGFLPRRPGQRRRLLTSVASLPYTLVFLEAPHRLQVTLADLEEALGNCRLAVARELTKIHEEVFRGTISQARAYFSKPIGEFTLVVEGRIALPATLTPQVEERLRRLKSEGRTAREAIAQVAGETGLSRKELYRAWLRV